MKRVMAAFCVASVMAAIVGGSAPGVAARQELAAARTQESVPRLVQFSGTLKDSAARTVSGVASVTFAVYAGQEGGAALWSETQNVLADANGHYSVLLGAATASGFPAELIGTGESRWVGVTMARAPEQARVLLASVPYALKAGDADTLGGLPASSYVTTQQLAARSVVGAAATTIVAATGGSASGMGAGGNAADADGAGAGSITQSVTQAAVTGSGTAQYLPLWTSGSNLGVSKIYQAAGGFVGINTNTPLLQLDVNGNSIFRGSFQMAPQEMATASAGQPSHSFQWQASLYDSSKKAAVTEAFGFRTVPATNDVAGPTAKLDLFYGPGGGTLNDTGLSMSNSGLITFAPGQTFNGSQLNLVGNSPTAPLITGSGGTPLVATYSSGSSFFLGPQAGAINSGGTGFNNDAVGAQALANISTGSNDVAVGYAAMVSLGAGSDNTAVGFAAADSLVLGSDNSAVGSQALVNAGDAVGNTAVGMAALQSITSGNYGTAIGFNAGQADVGFQNVWLGALANPGVSTALHNAVAIGYAATVSQSDSMALGGQGEGALSVGIGTATPHSQLEVAAIGGPSFLAPNPVFTLTSTSSGVPAIDFNTQGISSTGAYNPALRIAVIPEASGNVLAIYANKGTGLNQGLQQIFAIDSAGNAAVTGNLSKGGGSFKIDDPIDPAGKYLSHSFVESPDMKNIYDGLVTLDAHGAAVVTMPEWFDALNRDFRYQLTSIGAPGPKLYVAEKMHGNQFRIAGGKKGQEVSWQVTGIRQDAWANAHRIPTEELKPVAEQGKYLHPELFGEGPEKAIGAGAVASANGAASLAASAPPQVAGRD